MNNEGRIGEKDLILPALKIINDCGENGITTADLIPQLRDLLAPSREDTEILQGRKDDKFSQKVRNLVSHKTLQKKGHVKFENKKFYILDEGRDYLSNNIQNLDNIVEKENISDEYESPIKSYFNIFQNNITNIKKFLEIQVDDSLKQNYINMLYASVITVLETFLYDALKFHIFNHPNDFLLRRFIEGYTKYQDEQFFYNKLYELFEYKEDKVNKTIDAISYHRLKDISDLYKSIFLIEFEVEKMGEIERAIYKRHDLVHRNGKKKNGDTHNINKDDVEKLISCIEDFASSLETNIQSCLQNLVL